MVQSRDFSPESSLPLIPSFCLIIVPLYTLEYQKKAWPKDKSLQEEVRARLEEDTERIIICYNDSSRMFKESYLSHNKCEKDRFEKLCKSVDSLFHDLDAKSFKCTENLLHEIIRCQQSYVNFGTLVALIRECGTKEDVKNFELYVEAYKTYAKRRIFECSREALGKEIQGHETMMFILDERQSLRLISAHRFILKLCDLLESKVKPHQIMLHRVGCNSVIIVIQIPSKHVELFRTLPLFRNRMLSLQEWYIQRYELRNEVVQLKNWYVINSLQLGSDMVIVIGNTEFLPATLAGSECLALRYTDNFSSEATADVGYIKYLDGFSSGKFKNLPDVKGICYGQSSKEGLHTYPMIVVDKLKSLKSVSVDQEVLPVTQTSILFDVCCSVASFEGNQSYQVSVLPDSVFIHDSFDSGHKDNISACFCPLYGHSFHIKKADVEVQQLSSHPMPLPLESMQWMNELIKFIQFKGNSTASTKLPEDHILKQMFDQKWMSDRDNFRPTSFKVLSKALQHLLGEFG